MPAKPKPAGKPMEPSYLTAQIAELAITREALASEWCVSTALIWRWERGKVVIPGWVRYALAGVPVLRERRAAKAGTVTAPKPVETPTEPDKVAWIGLKKR